MAVFTPLDDLTIKEFLNEYDLGDFVRAEGILQGVENTNYHVFTSSVRI